MTMSRVVKGLDRPLPLLGMDCGAPLFVCYIQVAENQSTVTWASENCVSMMSRIGRLGLNRQKTERAPSLHAYNTVVKRGIRINTGASSRLHSVNRICCAIIKIV